MKCIKTPRGTARHTWALTTALEKLKHMYTHNIESLKYNERSKFKTKFNYLHSIKFEKSTILKERR